MTPATGPRAVAAWDRVSTDTVKLIAEAADRSNLTLDPDLDTYYLQDTINVKIPTLLDAGGRGRRPRCRRCQGPSRRDRDCQRHDRQHGRGDLHEPPEGGQEHRGPSPRAGFGRAAVGACARIPRR